MTHPGKWQLLRARREKSRRQKAEEAAAERKRKVQESNQTDEEKERAIWEDTTKILETIDDDKENTRDTTVSWASAIEVLGSWISPDGSNTRDLCERLRKATKLWRAVLARLPKLSPHRNDERQCGESHGFRVVVVSIHGQSGQRHEGEDDDDRPAAASGNGARGDVHRGPHAWLDRPHSQARCRTLGIRNSESMARARARVSSVGQDKYKDG